MRSFRQFLYENDYPGAYYDEQGNFVEHFRNREEKEEYDQKHPDVDYTFTSDKRMSQNEVKNLLKVNVAKDILAPIGQAASTAALGDGILGEIPVEQIENNIEKLEDELAKSRAALQQIRASYQNTRDKNLRKTLKDQYDRVSTRISDLTAAKRKYEQNNYK